MPHIITLLYIHYINYIYPLVPELFAEAFAKLEHICWFPVQTFIDIQSCEWDWKIFVCIRRICNFPPTKADLFQHVKCADLFQHVKLVIYGSTLTSRAACSSKVRLVGRGNRWLDSTVSHTGKHQCHIHGTHPMQLQEGLFLSDPAAATKLNGNEQSSMHVPGSVTRSQAS